MPDRPTLLLVHEPEAACRANLHADGFSDRHALEISSYLAQSTDLAPEFVAIGDACAVEGIGFEAVELGDASKALSGRDPANTLVWTLTDGIAYFRGGAAPALARLNGLKTFGADDALFALCQDKFRAGAVLRAMGMPVPEAGLARNGELLVEPEPSDAGYFVKPNRLGAKIGIWPDSRCNSLPEALALSQRIFAAYRDDALVQRYVPGRNVRASYLGIEPNAGMDRLGVFLVESGGDFQTMSDSLALYGETAVAVDNPQLEALAGTQPQADAAIRLVARRLNLVLGLRDVFSLDFRVGTDGALHLLEFEVCPGLPCFDFRDYCRSQWGMTLPQAMAQAASNRLRG